MSARVDCPSCGHRLVVSPRATGPWLTCPECLARVANPNVRAGASPREAITAATGPTGTTTCTSCGEPVNAGWRFCPFCNARLEAPPPPARSGPHTAHTEWLTPPVDEEVRRDTTGMGIGIIILGVIALAGALLTFSLGERGTGGLLLLVVLACAVLFLAVGRRPSTVPRAERDREEPAPPRERRPPAVVEESRPRHRGGDVAGAAVGGAAAGGAGGLLAGCAMGVVAALVVVVVVLLAILAAVISAIQSCFDACNKLHG